MFFFPFVTEPYLAIKLFAKRKQLIVMVAKTGAERSKEYRESINGHLFRFLHFCSPGTFGKNAFLLW